MTRVHATVCTFGACTRVREHDVLANGFFSFNSKVVAVATVVTSK